jgi:hypothetical protein
MADSTASSFTIRELTGDQRTLRLAGRAAPLRGITFGVHQRIEKTWYGGNPEATSQVQGPEELATDPKGVWSDRFLRSADDSGRTISPEAIAQLDGIQVEDVMGLSNLMEDIARKGQLLEVTWDAKVRRGYLEDWIETWQRREDMEWEMKFSWVSQGDPEVPPVLSRQVDLSDVSGSWANLGQQITDAVNNSPVGQLEAFSSQLDAKTSQVVSAINQVSDAVSSTIDGALSPLDSIRRVVGVLDTIRSASADLLESLEEVPVTLQFDFTTFADAPSQLVDIVGANVPAQFIAILSAAVPVPQFGDALAALAYRRNIYALTRQAARQAALQSQDLGKQLDPDLIATFVAHDGQNLRDVSTLYYATPDQWKGLRKYNHLKSSALVGGQVIFVPMLDSLET